jgi:hypothetical protein
LKAVNLATRACELTPSQMPLVMGLLPAAQAQAGFFDTLLRGHGKEPPT